MERISSCNFDHRILWLDAGYHRLTDRHALRFEEHLTHLNSQSLRPIHFFISGISNNLYACLKIAALIEQSPSEVVITGYDMVGSLCFLMMQARTQSDRLAWYDTTFQ